MEQAKEERITSFKIKPRNGFIAFLLSLFLPGLGQVYNGQPKKGAILFGLLLLSPVIFGFTRWAAFFSGLVLLSGIEIGLRLYSIIDGVRNARRQKEYVLKPYNTWYYHLIIAIGMLTVLSLFDASTFLGTQTFTIPTISNNPTFQVGDYVVADMKAYENVVPDYGDIVVYSRPDGEIYTFRLVGRPNDTIALVDNVVSINGKLCKATFIKETTNNGLPVAEFEEQLPNGHKHLIYKLKESLDSTKANIQQMVVPSNSYYLLGDNRDNAADSRYEGFVSKDRIKGRVVYSYWGKTGFERMNIDFRDK